MTVFLLRSNEDRGWIVMPQVMRRIFDFSRRYDPQGDPAVIAANLAMNFTAARPMVAAVAGLDDSGLVRGHLLLSLDPWAGKMACTVMQYQAEGISRADRAEGWRLALEWATLAGAERIDINARCDTAGDRRRARLFRLDGFVERGVLMSRPLLREAAFAKAAEEIAKEANREG